MDQSSGGGKIRPYDKRRPLELKLVLADPNTTARNATEAIILWCAASGIPNGLILDDPSNFKNETIWLVFKGLDSPHHFTLPGSPWRGWGSKTSRPLTDSFLSSGSKLAPDNANGMAWYFPVVQSVFKNSPSPQRGRASPITYSLGRDHTTPVLTFLITAIVALVTLADLQKEHVLNIDGTLKFRLELHLRVQNALANNREHYLQHQGEAYPCLQRATLCLLQNPISVLDRNPRFAGKVRGGSSNHSATSCFK